MLWTNQPQANNTLNLTRQGLVDMFFVIGDHINDISV